MIIDPTKKPLITRISANPVASGKTLTQRIQSVGTKPKGPAKAAAKKPAVKKAKKPKKEKKTIEQLDQEMADYFEN